MNNQKGEIATVLTIAAIVVVTVTSLVSNALLGKNKQTTTTSAQSCQWDDCEKWKCPGNQCNRCGIMPWGWWASGCWTQSQTGITTPVNTGCCTPCGNAAKICKNPGVGNCGNDGCFIGNPPPPGTAGYCKNQSGNNAQYCNNINKCDVAGACNPACCNSIGDCPAGQGCSVANGYCKSGTSCGQLVPTATPRPNPTATRIPTQIPTTPPAQPTNTPVPPTAPPSATNTPMPTLGTNCSNANGICGSLTRKQCCDQNKYQCSNAFSGSCVLKPIATPPPGPTNTPPQGPTNTPPPGATNTPVPPSTGPVSSVTFQVGGSINNIANPPKNKSGLRLSMTVSSFSGNPEITLDDSGVYLITMNVLQSELNKVNFGQFYPCTITIKDPISSEVKGTAVAQCQSIDTDHPDRVTTANISINLPAPSETPTPIIPIDTPTPTVPEPTPTQPTQKKLKTNITLELLNCGTSEFRDLDILVDNDQVIQADPLTIPAASNRWRITEPLTVTKINQGNDDFQLKLSILYFDEATQKDTYVTDDFVKKTAKKFNYGNIENGLWATKATLDCQYSQNPTSTPAPTFPQGGVQKRLHPIIHFDAHRCVQPGVKKYVINGVKLGVDNASQEYYQLSRSSFPDVINSDNNVLTFNQEFQVTQTRLGKATFDLTLKGDLCPAGDLNNCTPQSTKITITFANLNDLDNSREADVTVSSCPVIAPTETPTPTPTSIPTETPTPTPTATPTETPIPRFFEIGGTVQNAPGTSKKLNDLYAQLFVFKVGYEQTTTNTLDKSGKIELNNNGSFTIKKITNLEAGPTIYQCAIGIYENTSGLSVSGGYYQFFCEVSKPNTNVVVPIDYVTIPPTETPTPTATLTPTETPTPSPSPTAFPDQKTVTTDIRFTPLTNCSVFALNSFENADLSLTGNPDFAASFLDHGTLQYNQGANLFILSNAKIAVYKKVSTPANYSFNLEVLGTFSNDGGIQTSGKSVKVFNYSTMNHDTDTLWQDYGPTIDCSRLPAPTPTPTGIPTPTFTPTPTPISNSVLVDLASIDGRVGKEFSIKKGGSITWNNDITGDRGNGIIVYIYDLNNNREIEQIHLEHNQKKATQSLLLREYTFKVNYCSSIVLWWFGCDNVISNGSIITY